MTSLSCFIAFFFSLIPSKLVDESLYRIKERGLLCCLLLPLIQILSNVAGEERFIYSIFCNGLTLTSLIPLVKALDLEQTSSNLNLMASFGFISAVSYWMVLLLTKIDLMTSLVILILLTFLWLMQSEIPSLLPGSFTFGELTILTQGIVSFLLNLITRFFSFMQFSFRSPGADILEKDAVVFSQVAGLCCALFVGAVSLNRWFRLNIIRTVILLGINVILAWSILNVQLSKDPVLWLVQALFKSKTRVCLLAYWFLCVSVAILLTLGSNLVVKTAKEEKSYKRSETTKVRKLFHVLISLVFLPGVLIDRELLFIASVVATSAMIVAESIRFFDIPPLGAVIRQKCSVFLDDQDKGSVVLTPLYLLIGCSSSLWLSIGRDVSAIFPLVGLLSLGIGDSSASYFGSKYGKFHWKDSPKSLEGTLASMISQGAFITLLQMAGLEIFSSSVILPWRLITAVALSSLYESFTNQIDNLVLPLFTYLLLC